jgi:FtsP/CotA-like multicopper oxidase with cupredoxin domain
VSGGKRARIAARAAAERKARASERAYLAGARRRAGGGVVAQTYGMATRCVASFLAPVWWAAVLLMTSGCTPADEPGHQDSFVDGGAEATSAPPARWDEALRLKDARVRRHEAKLVEIDLEAKVTDLEVLPGKRTPIWTYDGRLPGPLIRVRVGDRLIVNFTNRLPDETTIHWHGLRIPPEMDGVPDHPHPAVKPGQTFRYDFVVPDAGLFWYHPHVRSAEQTGDGLYGAILVEPEPGSEPADLGDELVLVLSDMSLDDQGGHVGHHAGGDLATLFGREGAPMLVNGRVTPTLLARPGRRQRWRIVNAARSRYFQVGIEGQSFVRLGGDGGFLEGPLASEKIVVIPGQRADVVFTPTGRAGETLTVKWIPYDRGFGSTFNRPAEEIMRVRLEGGTAPAAPALPARLRTIVRTDPQGAPVTALRLTSQTVDKRIFLGVNGMTGHDAPPLQARIGQTQVWDVTNEIDFAHPFHLHGFFFQVLEMRRKDGSLMDTPLEWRDTADVPAKGSMKLVVRFDERPGLWMFHCHILDHADAGMMGMIELRP